MLELSPEFPGLMPSGLAKVLARLCELKYIERAGDPALIYVGGVEFWATPRNGTPHPSPVTGLVEHLEAEISPLSVWPDRDGREVAVAVPLVDLVQLLSGDANVRIQRLMRVLARLRAEGRISSTRIVSEFTNVDGEAAVQLCITP
jgi:hypothetical protein